MLFRSRTAESASVSREIQPDPGRAQDAEPRQGADPSPLKASAAAVSRTVVGVFRDLKGKRSTEEGTTDGHDKDFGRNEDELLGERNRQESTTNGLHVDLDAHASVPSLSDQTAVSSGASFKREAELSGNTDSRRTNHLSNVSHGELDNGTAVLDGRQSPGKAPLPPEPKAVVPSVAKSAEALPPVKQAVAAEGRRERVRQWKSGPQGRARGSTLRRHSLRRQPFQGRQKVVVLSNTGRESVVQRKERRTVITRISVVAKTSYWENGIVKREPQTDCTSI